MAKDIKYGDDLRQEMFKGVEKVAKTVGLTMGPKGRNVVIDRGYGAPQVTNDGATIAKDIVLKDKFESLGAELVKQASAKTNDIAGDGTTTATLLTYALISEGLREIRTGINAVELKNGMKKAGERVSIELESMKKDISTIEEIAQVASLSAQDAEVGDMIAKAMDQVGNNGVIQVQEGQTFGLELEITEGMEFDEGYLSPYMVSDTSKMISELKNAKILITDKKISSSKELIPLLEQLLGSGIKDLVILAQDIEGEALTTLVLNRLKGVINILGIKNPGYGDDKKEMLKDIAILTGANIITDDLKMKLEDATLDDLGDISSIVSEKNKTTIVTNSSTKDAVQERIYEIKSKIDQSSSKFEADKLQKRLAKLGSGVALIKVGARSEIEMKERKLRIEDALNATKAGVEEGVVAGGGVALLKASKVLDSLDLGDDDQNIGVKIVKNALSSPIRQIVDNAGKEPSVIVNEVLKNDDINYGYDAAKDMYVDMLESGLIDPKKVSRVALEQSISLAGMFLISESGIVDIEEEKEDPMGGMPGMGMY